MDTGRCGNSSARWRHDDYALAYMGLKRNDELRHAGLPMQLIVA
jgi:hypothetical protein